MTATATATWPTAEELHSVERLLVNAANAAEELKLRLHHLVNVEAAPALIEGAQAPYDSDLGTWTVFCAHVELELVELRRTVEHFVKVRDAVALDLPIKESPPFERWHPGTGSEAPSA